MSHKIQYDIPIRMRRNRYSSGIRAMVAENAVTVNDLIYPVFILDGSNRKEAINSMPGQSRVSLDNLLLIAQDLVDNKVNGIALFPVIEGLKDNQASQSYADEGLVQTAIRLLKSKFPQLVVFSDVALDPYTIHGQDGIIDDTAYVLNDETIEVLIKQALSHARAGVDFVSPSDMMDGRIGLIRDALDQHGFINVGIMAYSAKYASKYYGPFRDAVGSSSNLANADKKNYQLNPANIKEAMCEVALDIAEGADMVMVKPGLPYLDVVSTVANNFDKPVAVYHVSGEYAMLKAASLAGYLDYDATLIETMLCFKRAGADMIWTYSALDVARILNTKS